VRREPEPDSLALAVYRHEMGAFERLVETFERGLFNYSHRLLQNAFDAQEVVQDVFLRAHRALTRQYSEERCKTLAIRPWLFRIARNLSYNRRRGKRSKVEQPLSAFDDGRIGPLVPSQSVAWAGSSVASPQSSVLKREEAAELDRAMTLLPAESRDLIVLRFMEEMPYGEIARITGHNEAALRGKVFRSLKLLREALAGKGVAHAV